jgi:hypothetical protein
MGVALEGGEVKSGDEIEVMLPTGLHHPLKPV